ncbi:CLUMA_CG019584, isoform A [Clunio marinus]|uniref:Sensory neuron membrane protein 2 n=1 Tax=Clunio marinus TaxID=568069 RepID=A0A1J1J3I7_9DIPT|nr:CLUMA_CG019584, isoform A [Clunio marinus]
MSKWILVGPFVGVVLITVALIIGYVVVPPIVDQRVTENVQLVEGTEQYERWVEVPQPLDFKVYIFNVTNVDEIQRGMIPKLEEIGPFVYSQSRKKHNIRFSRSLDRVSYYSQMSFTFNKEKSGYLTEDMDITVLNMHMNTILQIIDKEGRQIISNMTRGVERTIDHIPVVNVVKKMLDRYTPLQSILQTVENETPFFMPVINDQLHTIFGPTNSFFVKTTPRKFLFDGVEFCRDPVGVAQLVCQMVEDRKSATITKTPDNHALRFSMFNHKNVTHDGLYEVNTGIRRLERLMRIERWNNARVLPHWKADKNGAPTTCQFINGTDGTAVAPFRQANDNLYIFSSDICRSVQVFYDEEINYNGIRGFRYSIRNNFLNEMPDCFCIDKIKGALTENSGCLYPGALDLTDCLDAPVVATLPHFLNADPRYNVMVEGLNATPEKHNIFMDVEPYTGSPLRGGKRMQFNMFLKQIEQIKLSENFKIPRLFPVLWVDEGLELNEEMTDLIKGDLTNVLTLVAVLQWSFVGIGVALIFGMLLWYYLLTRKVKNSASVDPIYDVKG